MDALETIMTRRSVRKFKNKPIEEAIINMILRAAMSAPSAGNQQAWHFIVIDDRKLLDAITTVHPYSQMCKEAPLAIMVCAEPGIEKHPGYWTQDCSAATENILLAVRALGLGAVWLGVYPREDRVKGLQKLFGLPGGIIPLSLIPIGHTEIEQKSVDRYNEERVHHNAEW